MKKNGFTSGVYYLIKGYRLLGQKGLRKFVLTPIFLSILFFTALIAAGSYFIHRTANYFMRFLPHWLHWLTGLLWILFILAGLFFIIYLFLLIINIFSAPFNSFLSEKVERIMLHPKTKPEPFSLKNILKEAWRAVAREFQKLIYYLPRALLLIVISFIPLLNFFAGFLWFIFSAWMMAVEYTDYFFDNHKKPFKDLHPYLRKHCLRSLGFGCSVLIASLIPIINFAVIPAAVIGATLMVMEKS